VRPRGGQEGLSHRITLQIGVTTSVPPIEAGDKEKIRTGAPRLSRAPLADLDAVASVFAKGPGVEGAADAVVVLDAVGDHVVVMGERVERRAPGTGPFRP
jgi:hypothetical protein